MLLEQYGHGFPASFSLVSIDQKGLPIHTLHEGPFHNPGRNLTSFLGSKHIVSGIRLYIYESFQKQMAKLSSFSLSEVQIINDKNENIALKSQIMIEGLENIRPSQEDKRTSALIDGQTPKGYILDLQEWLKKLAKRNQTSNRTRVSARITGTTSRSENLLVPNHFYLVYLGNMPVHLSVVPSKRTPKTKFK